MWSLWRWCIKGMVNVRKRARAEGQKEIYIVYLMKKLELFRRYITIESWVSQQGIVMVTKTLQRIIYVYIYIYSSLLSNRCRGIFCLRNLLITDHLFFESFPKLVLSKMKKYQRRVVVVCSFHVLFSQLFYSYHKSKITWNFVINSAIKSVTCDAPRSFLIGVV